MSEPPAPEALVAGLWPDYDLAAPTACQLLQSGFNDHYLVSTSAGEYVLRLYRRGWRTADDIAYELAALVHLSQRGVPVCAPIARRDVGYQSAVRDAEGSRTAVLFPCAPGEEPDATDLGVVRACGRVVALIHRHSEDFICEHRRFQLDLDHLLYQPLAVLLPYLAHRPADVSFLPRVAGGLRAGLEARVGDLEWGFCHGDFHGGNIRIDAGGSLRVFDFDCGGPGWRAYDLSVCRLYCGEDAQWETFCDGYQEVRPLAETTRTAIPWFVVARQIWRMAAFASNWPRLIGGPVNDDFLDHHLGVLRTRLARYLPALSP